MDCHDAQGSLLDSLVGPLSAERRAAMENHIAGCGECARFAEVQRTLDTRLAGAVPVASLSPGFRRSLERKIRHDAVNEWSESLPDIAHLIGCALAVAVLLVLLPQHSQMVLAVGGAFTGITYFAQAVLRSVFDSPV